MCLCDTPIFEGGGYYANIYNDLIGTESLYDCKIGMVVGTCIRFSLLDNFVYLVGTTVNVPFQQVT